MQFYSQKLNHLKEDLGLILFTQKTCESSFYQQEFEAKGFEKLSYLPCTGLADIIETQQQAKIELFLRNYLDKQGIKPQKYSYLILACTHYELILKNLKTIFTNGSWLHNVPCRGHSVMGQRHSCQWTNHLQPIKKILTL